MPDSVYTVNVHVQATDAKRVASAVAEVISRLTGEKEVGALPLLTAAGRVLTLIINNPGIKIREIAGTLGVTEANIQRTVATLYKSGLIKRTAQGRQHYYYADGCSFFYHPEIQQLGHAIINMTTAAPEE